MTQRKKTVKYPPREAAPFRGARPTAPIPGDRYGRAPRRRSDGDTNRRAITLAILGGGVLIALLVLMASLGPKGGPSGGQQTADARAVETTLANLQERLRLNPSDLGAMIQLGNTYYDAKRWAEAVPWYEKALQSAPGNTDVRTDLGTAYLYSGNPEKAKEQWLKVLEQDPNKVQTHFNLAVLYSGETPPNMDAAAKEWETVIKLAPNSQEARTSEKNLKDAGRR